MDKQQAAQQSIAAADRLLRAINEHGLLSPQAIAAGHVSRAALAAAESAGAVRADFQAARQA